MSGWRHSPLSIDRAEGAQTKHRVCFGKIETGPKASQKGRKGSFRGRGDLGSGGSGEVPGLRPARAREGGGLSRAGGG